MSTFRQSRLFARIVPSLVFFGFVALGSPRTVRAQAPALREYQVKAVFLFNFLQFVEWPASAEHEASSPIRIGILGEDPFGGALDDAVEGENVQSRPVRVIRGSRIEDLMECHLLFISRSERTRVAEIVSRLGDKPVLLVSDIDGFTLRGGMIRFFLDGKKVRFEINPTNARAHGLKISSQLLSLGKIVGSP